MLLLLPRLLLRLVGRDGSWIGQRRRRGKIARDLLPQEPTPEFLGTTNCLQAQGKTATTDRS